MLIFLILSIIFNGALIYGVFNLLRKLNKCEDFIYDIQNQVVYVLDAIKKLDIRGAFEVDDEVGVAFTGIKLMINSLDNFIENEGE